MSSYTGLEDRFELIPEIKRSAYAAISDGNSVAATHGCAPHVPCHLGVVYARDRKQTCDYDFQSIVVIKYVDIGQKDALVHEEEVYKALEGRHGFPGLRWSGEWCGLYCIALDYVGCNFERLKHYRPDLFTPQTVAALATQMVRMSVEVFPRFYLTAMYTQIDLLKQTHSLGIIHGDIKPNNFTLGPRLPGAFGMKGVALVHLVDFGSSRRCDGGESDLLPSASFTPAFSSIGALLGHREWDIYYFLADVEITNSMKPLGGSTTWNPWPTHSFIYWSAMICLGWTSCGRGRSSLTSTHWQL